MPPALSRDDFLVGDANRAALAAIDAWPDWAGGVLLLSGPPGSGKSHLAQIWRAASGAAEIAGPGLTEADVEAVPEGGALAVEDIDRIAGQETALFHLLNRARERGATLLLTARDLSRAFALQPADLASRLRAAQPAALAAPDDDLLARLVIKLFADRQIEVDLDIVAYLVARMDRSFEAAMLLVSRLDQAALAERRPVTRPLAAKILAGWEPDPLRF
ncbi:MAG: chromosomal replication initiator DnaA [Bauldia sp.]|nr:chromosomal replication initiator DnaA [Bauldia sp.]